MFDQSVLYYIQLLASIAVVINLIFAGARPTKTMAWMLVVFLIPLIGAILYLMFGLNRRKYKFSRIKQADRVQDYLGRVDGFYQDNLRSRALVPNADDIHHKLIHLIAESSEFYPYPGNKVTLLRNGPDTFEAIFEALEKAEKFIHIQYYIIEEGELTDRMLEILKEKSEQGVEIRLLYDGVGSHQLSNKFLSQLQDNDIGCHCFLPIANLRVTSTLNYRNHRKIVVVDGKVGFTGGINISDKYIKAEDDLGIWHDMHLRVEGPAVNSLQAVFTTDWYFAKGQDDGEDLLQTKYFPQADKQGDSVVQVVASGPDSDFPAILKQYFAMVNQADDYVYIANSYIVPGEAMLNALQTAALSGVDVRILVPAKSDSTIVKWGVQSYFEEMLRAGIRIYLYPDHFLHSKVIVVDDSIASVGTANFDIRSFEQNFEVNAVIYDKEVAKNLKQHILEDMSKSQELDLEKFRERHWTDRLREGLAKIFSPIL